MEINTHENKTSPHSRREYMAQSEECWEDKVVEEWAKDLRTETAGEEEEKVYKELNIAIV